MDYVAFGQALRRYEDETPALKANAVELDATIRRLLGDVGSSWARPVVARDDARMLSENELRRLLVNQVFPSSLVVHPDVLDLARGLAGLERDAPVSVLAFYQAAMRMAIAEERSGGFGAMALGDEA